MCVSNGFSRRTEILDTVHPPCRVLASAPAWQESRHADAGIFARRAIHPRARVPHWRAHLSNFYSIGCVEATAGGACESVHAVE